MKQQQAEEPQVHLPATQVQTCDCTPAQEASSMEETLMSMYIVGNPKTKKLLKEWVADPEKQVRYYQPGPFGGNEPTDGIVYAEGPHYPKPHMWYATLEVKDGEVIKVK
jgi:hypothetical protein